MMFPFLYSQTDKTGTFIKLFLVAVFIIQTFYFSNFPYIKSRTYIPTPKEQQLIIMNNFSIAPKMLYFLTSPGTYLSFCIFCDCFRHIHSISHPFYSVWSSSSLFLPSFQLSLRTTNPNHEYLFPPYTGILKHVFTFLLPGMPTSEIYSS